jgi:hypothetical protein
MQFLDKNDPRYFDQATGRRLTARERAEWQRQMPGVGQIHEEIKPGVRAEERDAQQRQADALLANAKVRIERSQQPDPSANPFAGALADAQRELARADDSARNRLTKRLGMVQNQHDKWQAEYQQELARQEYLADKAYQNALEHAEAANRSPVHPSEINTLAVAKLMLENAPSAGLDAGEAVATYWDLIRASDARAWMVLDSELQTKSAGLQPALDEVAELQKRRDSLQAPEPPASESD